MKTIDIFRDYSPDAGGRFPVHGTYNGQTFRVKYLVPLLQKNLQVKIVFSEELTLDSSFIDEAFGGLVSEEGLTVEFLKKHLILESNGLDDAKEAWDRISYHANLIKDKDK